VPLTAVRVGDLVLCGRGTCPGQLPRPAPLEVRWAPDGQFVFDLDGWRLEDGVEHRVGKRRGDRSVQRARANTRASDAGKKMKAWSVAEVDGRRAKSLPFEAACPLCRAINVLDANLVTV